MFLGQQQNNIINAKLQYQSQRGGNQTQLQITWFVNWIVEFSTPNDDTIYMGGDFVSRWPTSNQIQWSNWVNGTQVVGWNSFLQFRCHFS